MSDDQSLEPMHSSIEAMAHSPHMTVHQIVEFEEAVWGFEVENQYAILDANGAQVMVAAEEGGGCGAFFTRQMLNTARPFVLHVMDPDSGDPLFEVRRPFKLYFDRVEVMDGEGNGIGVVQRRLNIINRIYTLDSFDGETMFTIKGKFWKPWTFDVFYKEEEEPCATIKKQWSGMMQEMFTDADTFGVEWEDDVDGEERILILAAVFLIDFRHFEKSNNR
jgi:uncharacterized protein YxjI